MALIIKDRVRETSTSTGTGAFVLDGARDGFQTFTSAFADGDTTYYTITDGTDWETGLGTWTEATATLTRTTVYESSNAGAAVDWSAGTKDVFCTYPSSKSIHKDASGNLVIEELSGDANVYIKTDASSTANINFGDPDDDNVGAIRYWHGADAMFFLVAGGGALNIDTNRHVYPNTNGQQDLGKSSLRWRNIYTSDLNLSNGVGDYTVVEGEEDLFLYNNKSGKVFKFALIEVDPSEATPKIEDL